jgi:thiol-disulfide isomerase/thioredoxin
MKSRRAYLLWAGLLIVIAVVAVAFAGRTAPTRLASVGDPDDLPVGRARPEINPEGWLNTDGLSADDLVGRVVVVDFWTYSCVNCVRTLPYLRAWWDRYKSDGLVIIGVHSPEFEFEKKDANVAAAVKKLDVTWPVAFDDDMDIWETFENQYWPAKYVFDRDGRLRFTHFGEGAYDDTEKVLRSLLGVKADAALAGTAREPNPPVATVTPETYLGSARAVGDEAAVEGEWQTTPEYVQSSAADAAIRLDYNASEVNLVMATADGAPIDVVVELDGGPVPARYRSDEVIVDPQGRTIVRVQASDLYHLIKNDAVEQHTLRLTPLAPGLQAFAFTFG